MRPRAPRAVRSVALLTGVVALCSIGVAAAIGRAAYTVGALADRRQSPSSAVARRQRSIQQFADIYKIKAGTPEYQDFAANVASFDEKFNTHWLVTLLHVVPGALLLALAPLQFSARIRSRHIRFHRWSGRVLLGAVAVVGLSALYYGLLMPYGGAAESSAVAVFGGFFLFAGARAFLAIRRRDVVHHREWMIRMFAAGAAISTVRIVDVLLFGVARIGILRSFQLSLWIGWLVTLAVAELWIRRTEGRVPVASSMPPPGGAGALARQPLR